MKLRTLFLLALAFLLVPGVAGAASIWAKCGAVSVATADSDGADRHIYSGQVECFYFNAAEDSAVFVIATKEALVCLDPNVASAGADNAEVYFRYCPGYVSAYDANLCIRTSDDPLDGTQGSSGTQNACQRLGRGQYVIENSTSAGTQEAFVSVQGE